jgi:hypothetical protein
MTIKQYGGVFGRNPTFNSVTVDGTLTVDQIVEKTGSAGITLDGVTLKDGNVVLANGKGIDFSATAGTGTSELFDDYEEGTWTPVISGSTSSGTGTYSIQLGTYTKVGNLVYVTMFLSWSAHTGTGNGVIEGLPFISASYNTISIRPNGYALTAGGIMTGFLGSGVSVIELEEYPSGGGALSSLALDAGAALILSASYGV